MTRAATLFSHAAIAATCWAFAAEAQVAPTTEVCLSPSETCIAFLPPECLQRSAAGALDVEQAEACDARLGDYRACIASIVRLCNAAEPKAETEPVSQESRPAPPPAAGDPVQVWNAVKDSGDVEALDAFASSYPTHPLSVLARNRADALRRAAGGDALERRAIAPEPAAAPEPPKTPDPATLQRRADQREAQTLLNELGYAVGAPDGLWGARSQAGMRAFQQAQELLQTGAYSAEALALLREVAAGDAAAAPAAAPVPPKNVETPVAAPPVAAPPVAAPLAYRAALSWSRRIKFELKVDGCDTVFEKAAAADAFQSDDHRCGASRLEYRFEVAPSGAVAGWMQVFSPIGSTRRLDIGGSLPTLSGRGGGFDLEIVLSPR